MSDGFSTLIISKTRSFRIPDIHLGRIQLIRYTALNFTYGVNDRRKLFLCVCAVGKTHIFWDDAASHRVQHLVAGVGGTRSRELWPVVMVMVLSLH